jgi:serine/threonine-protein kinase
MSVSPRLKPNDLLGPYRIIREIARGGMAIVYLAYQPALDRQVAIKVLASQLLDDNQFTERFRREARAVARLGHPNILTIHDYGEAEGLHFIVMEYVAGGSLRDRMRSALPATYVSFVLDQICGALDYAHDQGVVHRDVKPGNILLKNERWLVLSDFGLAKMLQRDNVQSLTVSGMGMGTPDYAAPEQIEGLAIDRRADIYSTGIVLFEMLAGRVPFSGDSPAKQYVKHLTEIPPALHDLDPRISPALSEVVDQCLRKRPEDRFNRAGDLAVAFKRAMAVSNPTPVGVDPAFPTALGEPPSTPGLPSQPSAGGAVSWASPPAVASSSAPSQSPQPFSQPLTPSGFPSAPIVVPPAPAQPVGRRPVWLWAAVAAAILVVALVAAVLLTGVVGRDAGTAVATVPAGATAVPEESVLVPAGEFVMGDDGAAETRPKQTLRLDAFRIDKFEVTRAQFRTFVAATGFRPDSPAVTRFTDREAQEPVVGVTWANAVAYCNWSGGRLPTEAEWEKAARGTDGRIYPWGNQPDSAKLNASESGLKRPRPVGSYPAGASPYGALDMAGNVAEWTQSLKKPYPYDPGDGRNDPSAAGERVIRGGSWENSAESARTFARAGFPADFVHPTVGFRCVR